MNRPLKVVNKIEPEQKTDRKLLNVIPINSEQGLLLDGFPGQPATALPMADYKYRPSQKDSKLGDYFLIALLTIALHGVIVNQLKRMPLSEEELVKPVKVPSKVQISFVQPKPKAVPLPPVVQKKPQPPPPPKVVPLKKPPKPKLAPKPIKQYSEPTPSPVKVLDAPVISAPPAPIIAPPPPKPKPVVEKITQPSAGAGYLNNPAPVYPEIAEERGWDGKVLMKVHVLASGRPDSVSVIKSSGHEVLDSEAVRTVKKWSFLPAKRGTSPIDGWVTVPISFNLAN